MPSKIETHSLQEKKPRVHSSKSSPSWSWRVTHSSPRSPLSCKRMQKPFEMSPTDTKGSGLALCLALAMAMDITPNYLEEGASNTWKNHNFCWFGYQCVGAILYMSSFCPGKYCIEAHVLLAISLFHATSFIVCHHVWSNLDINTKIEHVKFVKTQEVNPCICQQHT